MTRSSLCLVLLVVSVGLLASGVQAQTPTIIPANEAAAHVNEWATVEGVVCEGVHQQERKHISQCRSRLPESNFYWLDPAGITGLEISHAIRH